MLGRRVEKSQRLCPYLRHISAATGPASSPKWPVSNVQRALTRADIIVRQTKEHNCIRENGEERPPVSRRTGPRCRAVRLGSARGWMRCSTTRSISQRRDDDDRRHWPEPDAPRGAASRARPRHRHASLRHRDRCCRRCRDAPGRHASGKHSGFFAGPHSPSRSHRCRAAAGPARPPGRAARSRPPTTWSASCWAIPSPSTTRPPSRTRSPSTASSRSPPPSIRG